jgi:glycosyltransferase involved in cell wall biosynthesis
LKKTVDIVLATFNGEKYIAEQLKSIICQTYADWRLLISDDGSTDLTVDVVNYYCALDSRIQLVNKSRQGGVVSNFNKALCFVKSDCVMLCDQDDVWKKDKIEIMFYKLNELELLYGKSCPLFIFSDAEVVDSDLSIIEKSIYQARNLNPLNNLDPRFLLWQCSALGCTSIFNNALYKIAFPLPSKIPMHDQWLALVAAIHGHVYYHPIPTIFYRQHQNNVVGAKKKNLKNWLKSSFVNLNNTKKDVVFCYRHIDILKGSMLSNKTGLCMKLEFISGSVIPFLKERKVFGVIFLLLFFFDGKGWK